MNDIEVVHTADLPGTVRHQVRELLDGAFTGEPDGDFDEDDWHHTLGGLHVLARVGGVLAGHAAVVQRSFVVGGGPVRVGYVEAVAVAPSHRRQGLAGRLMDEVERIVVGAYDLGALGASDVGAALYQGRGWRVWRGPTSVLTPDGPRPTPDDDGGVHVFDPHGLLDLDRPISCDYRAGDVW